MYEHVVLSEHLSCVVRFDKALGPTSYHVVKPQGSHQDAVATGPPSGDVRWGKLQPLSSQQPRQRSQKEPAQSACQHSQSRSFKNHTALRTSLVVYGQLPSNTHVYLQYYFAKIYYCVNLGVIQVPVKLGIHSLRGTPFHSRKTFRFLGRYQPTLLLSQNTRQHGLHIDVDTKWHKYAQGLSHIFCQMRRGVSMVFLFVPVPASLRSRSLWDLCRRNATTAKAKVAKQSTFNLAMFGKTRPKLSMYI